MHFIFIIIIEGFFMIKLIITIILLTSTLAVKREDLVTNVPVLQLLLRDMEIIFKHMSMQVISIQVILPEDFTTSLFSPFTVPTTQIL